MEPEPTMVISRPRYLHLLSCFLLISAWLRGAVVMNLDTGDAVSPDPLTEVAVDSVFGVPLDLKNALLTGFDGDRSEQETFLAELQGLIDGRHLEQALERLDSLILLNPQALWPRRVKGWILIDLGKYALAERTARSLQATRPESVEALEILGFCALRQQDPTKALALYTRLTVLQPSNPVAWIRLARVHQRLGATEAARTALEKALDVAPGHVRALDALGLLAYQEQAYDQAVDYHRKALEADPEHAPSWNHLGSALFHQNRLEDALKAYRESVRLNPDSFDARTNLGAALAAKGEGEEALQVLSLSLDLNLNQPLAWHNLLLLVDQVVLDNRAGGDSGASAPRTDWAREQDLLEQKGLAASGRARTPEVRAVRDNLNDADAHQALGRVLATAGHPLPAVVLYRTALHLRPDFPAAFLALRSQLHLHRDAAWMRELVAQWNHQLTRDPTRAPLLAQLAAALEILGKPDSAVDRMADAVDASPDTLLYRMELARLQLQAGNAGPALKELGVLLDRFPDRPHLHVHYARACLAMDPLTRDDVRRAVLHAGKAVELTGGQDLVSLQVLALSQEASGQPVQALETCRKALAVAEARGDAEAVRRIQADMARLK